MNDLAPQVWIARWWEWGLDRIERIWVESGNKTYHSWLIPLRELRYLRLK